MFVHSILNYCRSGFSAGKEDHQLPSSGDYLLTHSVYICMILQAICKCFLYTLYILTTDDDASSSGCSSSSSSGCSVYNITEVSLLQAVCEIMAVCDVTATIITELCQQEVTTCEQIQQFYHTKLLATSATISTDIETTGTTTTRPTTITAAAAVATQSPSLLSVCVHLTATSLLVYCYSWGSSYKPFPLLLLLLLTRLLLLILIVVVVVQYRLQTITPAIITTIIVVIVIHNYFALLV